MRLSPHTAFHRGDSSPTGPLRSGCSHSIHRYYEPADFPRASQGPSSLHLRALKRSALPIPYPLNTLGLHCTDGRDENATDQHLPSFPSRLRRNHTPTRNGDVPQSSASDMDSSPGHSVLFGSPAPRTEVTTSPGFTPPGRKARGACWSIRLTRLGSVRVGRHLTCLIGKTVGDYVPAHFPLIVGL